MSKEIVVIVKEGQNVISNITVTEGSGRPLIIKAKSGQSYELKNITKGVAPDEIYVMRDGKNLKIKIGKRENKSDKAADIIIEEYFEYDSSLIGVAENGQYYNYIPQGADPAESYYSLGGESIVESETDWLPIILGVLGAGAIAAAASGGGSDNPPPLEGDAPDNLTIGVYDDNNDNDDTNDIELVGTGVSTASVNPAAVNPTTGIPVTNDNTPTVKGHTEAGATVTITFKNIQGKDVLTETVTADNNGNYRFTPDTALADGQYSVSAVAINVWGNSLPASTGVFEIDTVAPDAPDLDPTDGSEISGTAEAGSHITITDENGNVIGETDADQNGNFSYTPADPIADATVIEATATDAAGNESDPSTTTVDASIADAPTVYDDIEPIVGEIHNNDTTDDTQPEISGEAGSVPADVTVTIYDNGAEIGETTSNPDGSWSFTPGTPFIDGSDHSITYTKNGGTNHSPAVNFTVDTTPPSSVSVVVTDDVAPITGEIADNGVTDDTTPTISGKTEAGATVTIKDGSTELGTVTADGSGNYTFTPTTPLAEGAHVVSATASDAAGNSIDSATTNFTVDTTPPSSVSVVVTDDVAPITGEIADNGVTDDTTPTISGKTEAGATVTIKDGSTELGTVTADGSGNYTFTPTTPLAEGVHAVSATASDAAGNSVDSSTTHFTVDSDAPDSVAVAITAIAEDTGIAGDFITNDNTLVFSGTNGALGDGEKIQISLDGGASWEDVDQNGTQWSYDNTANTMTDGTYEVEARVVDAAGNVGSTDTQSVVVDTAAPTSDVAITGVADDTGIAGDFITGDNTLVFSGTNGSLGDGEKVQISLDGGNSWMDVDQNGTQWSYDNTSNSLADGTYEVEARVVDAAGNVGNNDTQTVVVDTTAPAATTDITAITTDTGVEDDFITSDTTLVIAGTNTALGADEKVQISLDGGATWLDAAQTDATHWSYDNSANAMISGEHTLQSRVVDAAGNAGEVHTQIVTIDTTAPDSLTVNLTDDAGTITGPIVSGTITDDTTPVISGTTEASASVIAKDDAGNTLGTATADSNGNYTITPTTLLSEGQHYISVTATDAAGNDITVSSVIFTVDTTAPVAPVLNDTDGSIVVGTAEPGSHIIITDGNGNEIGETDANQNGNFSYTPDSLIPDATVINATATDEAGNESDPGTTTVDATITDAPIIMDDVDPVLGQVLSGDTTNDDQPEISGSAGSVPGNVTVTIYDNNTEIGTTTSNADGSWSFTPSTPFTDGSDHSITYTKNGGTNHSPAVDFTVDTTAPDITMTLTDDIDPVTGEITNGSTTNDTKPTIEGTTEANATVTIRDGAMILGTVTADASGNYSFTPIAPLNEGAHAVNATATDAAGNTITSTTTNFTVDSIAPTVEMTITDDVGAVQGPVINGATIDDTKPTISGNTEAGATVTIKDGNTVLGTVMADSNGDYTFTPDEPLSMDEHTITATATDAAENTTEGTPVTFTIAPPEVIDLGDDGQLINPVFVDGKYYYYWDKDGDGKGRIEGGSDFEDTFTHDELDAIFMYDENGNLRPDNQLDTTDTYRYAELGGYEVALPTYGAETYGIQEGTEIDNNPEGEINPYYDDLVAIWDAFNGSEQTNGGPGTPDGWAEGFYWSATQYPDSDNQENHYNMDLTNGLGGTNGDHDTYWAAVEVIF